MAATEAIKETFEGNVFQAPRRDMGLTRADDLNKEIYDFINLSLHDTVQPLVFVPAKPLPEEIKTEAAATTTALSPQRDEADIDSNDLPLPPGLDEPDDHSKMLRASFLGCCFAVRRLIGTGCDVNYCDKIGRNALHYAAAGGRQSVVKILVDAGVQINLADFKGWTPLLIAVNKNYEEVTKKLLDNGGNPHHKLGHHLIPCRGEEAWSEAIHFAAIQGNQNISEMLLAQGVDINTPDSHNRLPLHYAACRSNATYTEWLLNNGSRCDALDTHKRTPLHSACLTGQLAAAQLLLERQCPVNVLDIWDMTAEDLALVRGYMTMVAFLKKYSQSQSENNTEDLNALKPFDALENAVIASLVTGLKEPKERQIRRAVRRLGSVVCLDTFQQSLKIEKEGGRMVADGSRRKSLGGIFFSLLKEKVKQNEISREDWDYVQLEEKESFLISRNRRVKAKSLFAEKRKPDSSLKAATKKKVSESAKWIKPPIYYYSMPSPHPTTLNAPLPHSNGLIYTSPHAAPPPYTNLVYPYSNGYTNLYTPFIMVPTASCVPPPPPRPSPHSKKKQTA